MSNSQDRHDEQQASSLGEPAPGQSGRSGQGAASALEQLIFQTERQRQQSGQAGPGPQRGGG